MPFYDYQCAACGTVFEVEHAMSAKPKPKCPQCGSTKTDKVFSPTGVQFKGGGFYVTDSRGSAGNSAGTSKDITPGKDGGADTKADTKPESKADTKAESKGETKPESKSADKPAKGATPKPDSAS